MFFCFHGYLRILRGDLEMGIDEYFDSYMTRIVAKLLFWIRKIQLS